MNGEKPLSADDAIQLNDYAIAVSNTFGAQFKEAGDRFKDSKILLQRFTKAVETVLTKGKSPFHAVYEAHNELCIASELISSTTPAFTRIDYEPPLTGCPKSIDFRATASEATVYIDVKTITPKPTDRWEQFIKFEQENWFPERVKVVLEKEWLGGELWHDMYASRERMLEHSLELEKKISDGNLASKNTFFYLALCGRGIHWHQSELEDFVSFYYTGIHRPDDAFSAAEAKYIKDKRITISRSISRFACMFRSQGSIYPNKMIWQVIPPK